jgi:hypothetical protein
MRIGATIDVVYLLVSFRKVDLVIFGLFLLISPLSHLEYFICETLESVAIPGANTPTSGHGKKLGFLLHCAPLRENTVGEAIHNRNRSSHSPFLHPAPVQGTRAPSVGFQSSRMHLCRG